MTTSYQTHSDFDYLLSDWTPETQVEMEDDILVQVAKVGGGTVGESYVGAWIYRVVDLSPVFEGNRVLAEGTDLYTGTPATHVMAADAAYDFTAFGMEG